MSTQPQHSPQTQSANPASNAKVHSVDALRGDTLAVSLFSENGFRSSKGDPEEWFAALDHFRIKKQIEHFHDSLSNVVARVAAEWAASFAWIKSVYVIGGNPGDLHCALTLLISVDDANTANSWECSRFALLVNGHCGHAIDSCIVEEDVQPQMGYVHSYVRSHAKP